MTDEWKNTIPQEGRYICLCDGCELYFGTVRESDSGRFALEHAIYCDDGHREYEVRTVSRNDVMWRYIDFL